MENAFDKFGIKNENDMVYLNSTTVKLVSVGGKDEQNNQISIN